MGSKNFGGKMVRKFGKPVNGEPGEDKERGSYTELRVLKGKKKKYVGPLEMGKQKTVSKQKKKTNCIDKELEEPAQEKGGGS